MYSAFSTKFIKPSMSLLKPSAPDPIRIHHASISFVFLYVNLNYCNLSREVYIDDSAVGAHADIARLKNGEHGR